MFYKNKKGFGLVEIIVAIGIFILFVIGIYGSIQFIYKVVFQSRLRIVENAIVNEQIELMRNLSFYDVGIENGSPAGVLQRVVTTTRNNIDFTITRTIRNIDDPFDGTIGGDPNDLSPADYKLVTIEVMCTTCDQKVPVEATTFVAPKYLEGDPTHGALFIEVFDANGHAVPQATVHIVSTSTDPAIDLTDTTDNDGMLRLVDLAEGLKAYQITVLKDGYTTDQTVASSVTVENPVKPFASVIAQSVTAVSFSIDIISTLDIVTLDTVCTPIGAVPFTLLGTKTIGTNPDVLLFDQSQVSGGDGAYAFASLVWDNYAPWFTSYDLIGAIPHLPLSLLPGAEQSATLVLGPNTDHSLIVQVLDSISEQPLSDATASINGAENQTKVTGLGTFTQTDWAGGDGQLLFSDESKYFTDSGTVDVSGNPGNIQLQLVGENYLSNGSLESSIIDLQTGVNLVEIYWEPLGQPEAVGAHAVQFQVASSNTSTPELWNYLGPDGTSGTYYNEENMTIQDGHDGDQYVRYQVSLHTDAATSTPVVSDIGITYTTSCTPPGQVYFGDITEGEYTINITKSGYQAREETIQVSGDMVFTVNMVTAQ